MTDSTNEHPPDADTTTPPVRRTKPLFALLAVLVVAVVVGVVFWPVLECNALVFDDNYYLTDNELVKNPGWDSTGRAGFSNWSARDVDLWAPGVVPVGPDPDDDQTHVVQGTSFASPYAAGVGALVLAANPTLSGAEALGIDGSERHNSCTLSSSMPHSYRRMSSLD